MYQQKLKQMKTPKKVDLKTCHWTELPNGWTPEGADIISKNVEVIHQRIDDFLRDSSKTKPSFGEFLGKFYNACGDPCPALVDPLTHFFRLMNLNIKG